MTKRLRLMITCDDGGLSPGIDEAVIQLHQQAMVSAVSLMCNMPHAEDALARYAAFPDLEMGVHLNLTEGQALTDAARQSALSKNGIFAGRANCFMQGLFLTNALQTIVFDELDAQMQVIRRKNLPIAHITTHHHFHLLPKMRQIVYELARKHHVNWVRNSRITGAVIPSNPFVQSVAHEQKPNQSFTEPDYVVLAQEWLKKSPHVLLSEMQKLNGLIELVIHPSIEHDAMYPRAIMYTPEERYQELVFIQTLWAISEDKIDLTNATSTNFEAK